MNLVILGTSLQSFIPSQMVCLSYKFFSQFITKDQQIEEIKTYINEILDHSLKESLLSSLDISNFKEDPKTYIYHQCDDITESYFIKRYAISQFLQNLAMHKKKNKKGKAKKNVRPYFYDQLMKTFINILEMYEQEVSKGTNPNFLIKEAVLYLLQNISNTIIKYSTPEEVEMLLTKFVIHELSSSNGILKERACSFINAFKNRKIKDHELYVNIAKKMCSLIEDEFLPVRVRVSLFLIFRHVWHFLLCSKTQRLRICLSLTYLQYLQFI